MTEPVNMGENTTGIQIDDTLRFKGLELMLNGADGLRRVDITDGVWDDIRFYKDRMN
jgi:hypothetical protein